uniref:Helicase C-terminal domain-containing protein n=1 Tax=Panagrolaimus superbus TaxID=310955 RepID=A0A914Y9R2_9BILA
MQILNFQEQAGIPVIPLSGIRAQNLREEAIREFRDNNVSVLTVTDIASRGIDIKDVDVVINFDMPLNYTTYVHRVGRAGRIRNGKSFSFVVPESDGSVVIELKKVNFLCLIF